MLAFFKRMSIELVLNEAATNHTFVRIEFDHIKTSIQISDIQTCIRWNAMLHQHTIYRVDINAVHLCIADRPVQYIASWIRSDIDIESRDEQENKKYVRRK